MYPKLRFTTFADMNPTLIYCYDAYCGWCYGFSKVITHIDTLYSKHMAIEVLSGGMILPASPIHISATAAYIQKAYPQVEKTTGVTFGPDFLWHINNPEESDWFPNSEKPAIAMCIFKDWYPEKQVAFAADLQYALHFEGRDLTDNAAYLHLISKYNLNEVDFFEKLASDAYKQKARYEFQLCKQLQVTGFPCLLLQTSEQKFFLIANGYTPIEEVVKRINATLLSLTSPN